MGTEIRPSEYARNGIVGIGTPQANPTVEQEVFALRPKGVSLVIARLTSANTDPEQRIRDYFERTRDYVAQFDDLEIDAFGVACTGSSYLLGAAEERRMVEALTAELGYPVVTAAAAIADCLQQLGARRISFVSPYPDWLADRALEYWGEHGLSVSEVRRVPLSGPNLHSIYKLSSADALGYAQQLDYSKADALLFSGTGMATLGAIRPLGEQSGLPVLSSNLCLMSALAQLTGTSATPLLDVPADLNTADL